MTLVIYFTDCVVSCWNQFISLAFEFNLLWTVVYNCIVVFVYWLLIFIGHIWLDGLAFCIHIVYIDVTLRFFLQFVYIRYILIAFNHFTCSRVGWLEVTLVIHFTDCVVTCRYQFISLAFEFNLLWAVVYHCVVGLVHWLSIFIGHIWLDGLAFCIHIVYIDITLRLFFELIDVGNILIFFSNQTSCRIRRLKVTFIIYFTDCVVTSWYQFVGLSIFFDCLRTVVHDCVVGLINWLCRFICDGSFQLIALGILIMNVNITSNIWFAVIVRYICRNFFNGWKRIVIKEWWVARSLIPWCVPTNDVGSIVSNRIYICWELRWICKGIPSGLIVPTTQAHIPISTIRISCYFKMVFPILTVNISDLFRFSCCSSRCWLTSWLNRIWSIQQSIVG